MNASRVPSPLAGLKREIEILVGVAFFAASIAMVINAAIMTMTEIRYADEAIVVPATVLERDFLPAERDGNPETRYRIRFRYVIDGAEQEQTDEVDVERWEALAPGAQFDLSVLPGEGARPRDGGLGEKIAIAAMLLGSMIFGPVGWQLGVKRLRRALKRIRAYYRGTEAPGEVVGVFDTGTAINRVRMACMRFRFNDARGVSREGETGLLYPAETEGLEPGMTGVVRYDPADPEISVWMGSGNEPR